MAQRRSIAKKNKGRTARSALKSAAVKKPKSAETTHPASELVIVTGLSGSGKLSALKAFEDMDFYAVDNLPMDLLPRFAELVSQSKTITRAALVVDVREGTELERFPALLKQVRRVLPAKVVFLDTADDVLVRRFSETRRPHPLGRAETIVKAIRAERKLLDPIRNVAEMVIDTSKFNVHELRAHITELFRRGGGGDKNLLVSCISFGYKNGVPAEADLVFDVRFLPNPHFVPEFRELTGRDPRVARYVRNFPQTAEFLNRVTDLLLYLLPFYIQEGKSYLTIAFGCTGGQHRSVFIAEEIRKRLAHEGYRVKSSHRDMPR
jgi:UPF0042 nucleotide-binding protein